MSFLDRLAGAYVGYRFGGFAFPGDPFASLASLYLGYRAPDLIPQLREMLPTLQGNMMPLSPFYRTWF